MDFRQETICFPMEAELRWFQSTTGFYRILFKKDDFKQMNDISRDFCIDMKNQQ